MQATAAPQLPGKRRLFAGTGHLDADEKKYWDAGAGLSPRAHPSLYCSRWPPEPALHCCHAKTGHASLVCHVNSPADMFVPQLAPGVRRSEGEGRAQTLMAPVESLPRAHVVGRPCPSQAVQHQRPDRHSPRGLEFLLPRKRGRASVLCVISKKKKGQRLAALPRQTRIKLSFTTPDTTGKACLDSSRRVHNQQNRRTPQRPATFRAWRTARQNVSETSRARQCRGSRTAPRPPFFFINQLFPPSPTFSPQQTSTPSRSAPLPPHPLFPRGMLARGRACLAQSPS
jgi:hypothetical protein